MARKQAPPHAPAPRSSTSSSENGHCFDIQPSPKLAPRMHHAKAIRLLDDLRHTLDAMDDKRTLWQKVSPNMRQYLREWLLQSSDAAGGNAVSARDAS